MVNVHVLQGERELASENHSMAHFELWGLPPLLRGMPQIEVTFKIDASGIVSVSAREKTTGRVADIKIAASGGLSEEDIDKMIADAEAQRRADEDIHLRIDKINEAKGLVYMAERSLSQLSTYLKDQGRAYRQELDDIKTYLAHDPHQMSDKDIDETKIRLEEMAREIAETAYKAMS